LTLGSIMRFAFWAVCASRVRDVVAGGVFDHSLPARATGTWVVVWIYDKEWGLLLLRNDFGVFRDERSAHTRRHAHFGRAGVRTPAAVSFSAVYSPSRGVYTAERPVGVEVCISNRHTTGIQVACRAEEP
jgi:hypothetical protein